MSGRVALAACCVLTACAGDRDSELRRAERDVVHAGLEALFVSREHAQTITLWADGREFAPTLSRYGGSFLDDDTLALWPLGVDGPVDAGLPLRVETTTLEAMEAFFAKEPAGWDAWFRTHPRNAGIVEVVKPRIAGDSAQLVVGRACGEHCHTAWRLQLIRTTGGWRVTTLHVLRLPR